MEHIINSIKKPIRGIVNEIAASINELSAGRIKPTHITILSVVFHLLILLAIYNDQLVQAGVMLIVFGLMDALDGSLARIQKSESDGGILLDASADRIKEILIYTGLTYWLAVNESIGWAMLAVLSLGGSMLLTFVKTKGEAIVAKVDKAMSATELNRFFSKGLMRFEIRMFLIVIMLLSGEILLFLCAICLFVWTSAFSQLIRVLSHLSR